MMWPDLSLALWVLPDTPGYNIYDQTWVGPETISYTISSSPITSILAVSPPLPASTPKASWKIPDDKLNGPMRCGDTNQKKQKWLWEASGQSW